MYLGTDGLALRVLNGMASERRLTDVDLHGITVNGEGLVFAVGDQGVILGSDDQGVTWTRLYSGTEAPLTAVTVVQTYREEHVVAAGDGIVLVRSAVTGRWQPVPPPDDGWGSLLEFGSLAGRTAALGRDGAVYLAADPRDPWIPEATKSSADIFAAGTIHGHTHRPADHLLDLDGAPATRIVLAYWHNARGEYLRCDRGGCTRVELRP